MRLSGGMKHAEEEEEDADRNELHRNELHRNEGDKRVRVPLGGLGILQHSLINKFSQKKFHAHHGDSSNAFPKEMPKVFFISRQQIIRLPRNGSAENGLILLRKSHPGIKDPNGNQLDYSTELLEYWKTPWKLDRQISFRFFARIDIT